MTIREAIAKIAFVEHSDDYALYFDDLFMDERIEECEEVREAKKLLKLHGITDKDVKKHSDRQSNIVPEPVRFIDRPRLIKIDTDDLPF